LKPASIEHIDRVLFDQTKGQLEFKAARDFLKLDAKPCEAMLLVEFYDDAVAERLQSLTTRRLGLRTTICKSNAEINLVLGTRKAGLTLPTGRRGDAKPVTYIEDTAVRPEQLPAYVAGLYAIIGRAILTDRFGKPSAFLARRNSCATLAALECSRSLKSRKPLPGARSLKTRRSR
jgi:FAD/FMN-containing dehydrogenase